MQSGILSAQNLVQNPSFEATRIIDPRYCPSAEDFDHRMKVWTSPTKGSPDILFDKLLDRMWPHRPNLSVSGYLPRTGRLMVGFRVYGCEWKSVHCKEYLQVPLKAPLDTGTTYLVEYWVLPTSNSLRVNRFGFAFSRGPVTQRDTRGVFEIEPMYESDSIIGRVADDWVRVSHHYKPDDTYTTLTIGVFAEDVDMEVMVPDSRQPLGYAYYLLDDIRVVDISDGFDENTSDPTGQIHLTLGEAFFEFDKSILTEQARNRLTSALDSVSIPSIVSVDVSGHTDHSGTEEYNQKLSERRAEAVVQQLVGMGVNEDDITSRGLGERNPVSSVPSRNRRVEVQIKYTTGRD